MYRDDRKVAVILTDDEFNQLKKSIENLERKIDQISAQSQQKSRFLWREFWIGFGVVFVIMVVYSVVV